MGRQDDTASTCAAYRVTENGQTRYFTTSPGEELLDAAVRYRRWWENRQYPRTAWTIDPCYDEPLCGSGYRWW